MYPKAKPEAIVWNNIKLTLLVSSFIVAGFDCYATCLLAVIEWEISESKVVIVSHACMGQLISVFLIPMW